MASNYETPISLSSLFESKYPNIVYEESDAEIVVVNLIEGVYYFLTGTAAYTWMSLHAGQSISEISQSLAPNDKDLESIHQDIESFVRNLLELSLVEQVNQMRQTLDRQPAVTEYVTNDYVPPALETYADLQDILLLDPVHDVDVSGWPTTKINE
jgi:hypothetical protein